MTTSSTSPPLAIPVPPAENLALLAGKRFEKPDQQHYLADYAAGSFGAAKLTHLLITDLQHNWAGISRQLEEEEAERQEEALMLAEMKQNMDLSREPVFMPYAPPGTTPPPADDDAGAPGSTPAGEGSADDAPDQESLPTAGGAGMSLEEQQTLDEFNNHDTPYENDDL